MVDKNKTKRAVGLKYSPSQTNQQKTADGKGAAPQVIAKGFGDLAEEIISLAKQHGVLVHEDRYLSEFLSTLDLGQEIPEELYYVIAELISFSYVLQGKTPEGWQDPSGKINTDA